MRLQNQRRLGYPEQYPSQETYPRTRPPLRKGQLAQARFDRHLPEAGDAEGAAALAPLNLGTGAGGEPVAALHEPEEGMRIEQQVHSR